MKRKSDKYTEKLSAYMDGRLSAKEMAEVAAHLEECPECSELLAKMKRLDDLAAGTEPQFDDALMNELTDRITAGLESVEEDGEQRPDRKPKVIPMWYKYAAVAASIAVVFFAGRMAFKDTGIDISGRGPSRHDISMPSATVRDKISEPPKEKAGLPLKDEIDKAQEKDADREKAEARQEAASLKAPKMSIPEPVKIPVGEEGQMAPSVRIENYVAEPAPPPPPPSGASLIGKVVDRETGRPLSGVTVQLKGSQQAALSDADGGFKISEVPADTYDLVYSFDGYETTEVEGLAITEEDIQTGYMEMEPAALAEQKSEESVPITIDSLEALYYAAVSGPMGSQKRGIIQYNAATESITQISKIRILLDSLEAEPKSLDTYWRLENLYIRARANYDMYLQTGDEKHLKKAGEFKNELKSMVNQLLEKDEENSILLEYQSEIDRWRF